MRRTLVLVLALALASVASSTGALAVAAPAKHHASPAQRLCSHFLSTSQVAAISGEATKPYGPNHGVNKYPKKFGGVPLGKRFTKIDGSVCNWIDDPEPSEGLSNTAFLLVGYSESHADWKKLVAYFKAGAPDTGYPTGFSDTPTYTGLKLGHGSKAFLTTVDLGKYYGYAPGQYPGVASFLYAVTVLTARHNVLQVWFANATAETTEGWVEGVLTRDAGFF